MTNNKKPRKTPKHYAYIHVFIYISYSYQDFLCDFKVYNFSRIDDYTLGTEICLSVSQGDPPSCLLKLSQ